VNIIIVHPRGVVFPRVLSRGKTTSQGWTIVLLDRNSIYNNVGCNKHLFVCFYLVLS
jgi:hypothetical protein